VDRCCDDTSCQEASEFLCTKTSLFWGSSATKKSRHDLSNALLFSRFQKFVAGRKKDRTARGFLKLRSKQWITVLIRCQTYWEVILFTVGGDGAWTRVGHNYSCVRHNSSVLRNDILVYIQYFNILHKYAARLFKMCMTCIIHMCDMTRSCVKDVSRVKWMPVHFHVWCEGTLTCDVKAL